jgi:hypothetical protein
MVGQGKTGVMGTTSKVRRQMAGIRVLVARWYARQRGGRPQRCKVREAARALTESLPEAPRVL